MHGLVALGCNQVWYSGGPWIKGKIVLVSRHQRDKAKWKVFL